MLKPGQSDSSVSSRSRLRYTRIVNWFLEPAPPIVDLEQRRQARLLSALLLILILLGGISGLVQYITTPNFEPTFIAILSGLLVLGVAYGLVRTAHYLTAAVITCIVPSAASYISLLANPKDQAAFVFMLLGIFLAGMLLEPGVVIALAVFNLGGILLVPLLQPDWPETTTRAAFSYHLIFSALIVMANRHRFLIERDRQQALIESESKFRLISEQARLGIIIFQDNRIQYVNHAIHEINGHDPVDMLVWSTADFFSHIHPDDLPLVMKDQHSENAGAPELEAHASYRLIDRHGKIKWVDQYTKAVSFQGKPADLITLMDVTEHKLAELEVLANEVTLQSILETAIDAYISMDANGFILDWNKQAEVTFGWKQSEAIGQNLADLIIPEGYHDAHRNGLAHYLATGEGPILKRRIEIEALHRDRHIFPIELSVNPIARQDAITFSAFIRDITPRRQMDEALRRNAKKMAALSQASWQILTTFDAEQIYKNTHQAVRQLMPCEAFVISLFDQSSQTIEDVYLWDDNRRWPNASQPAGQGLTDYIVKTNKPLRINQWDDAHDQLTNAETFGISERQVQAILAVPLVNIHKQCFGMISAQSYVPDAYTIEHEQFLLTITALVSKAIENSELLFKLQQELETRRQVGQELRETTQLLESIIQFSPVAIITFDVNGQVLTWNPGAEQVFGWQAEEVIGGIAPHIGHEHLAEFHSLRQRVIRGEALTALDLRRNKKDGTPIVVELNTAPRFDEAGTLTGYVAIVTDITERKRAQEARDLSKAQLLASLETTPSVAVQWYDQNGRILFWNPASEALYGWTAEEAIGKTLDQLIHTPEEQVDFLHILTEIDQTGNAYGPYEAQVHTREGESGWVLATTFKLPTIGGDQCFVCMDVDITALKQTQAEREKLIAELTAKNAELEQFTYTVSHDLRSPLVTIKGFLGYLEQDALNGDIERLKADAARIANATEKMQELLNDLLELSRVGRFINPSEQISFAELTAAAIELLDGQIRQRGVTVQTQPNLPIVQGDRQRLMEVLQNLISNAIKYMGDQAHPRVEIGQHGQEAGMLIFYIKDNGIGIAPEYHDTIFGLFNKLDARSEGTGIGLALVKRIIEFHGGQIWVESEPDQGSTFYFTLPSN